MNILFVSLMIFALFQIQPVAAAEHVHATNHHDSDTVYRPDFAAGSLCHARWGGYAQEWIIVASRTINLARNKDKDYSGYSFEFDVDKEGLVNNIKTLVPRNADQRIAEVLLTANKLPTPIPMKADTTSKRHLKLVLSKFPYATLQFAD